MNITLAQYTSFDGTNNDNIRATIDSKILNVPLDPANRHYQAILEWVEDGNTIEDAD